MITFLLTFWVSFPVYGKNFTFALVPKYHSVFFDQSGSGCKAAAAQLKGVECIYRGPIKGDVRLQDKIIESLIEEGVDGIAISVTESSFLARSSIQKAQAAGIPIITYDSDFNVQALHKYGNLRLAYIGTDNFQLGWAFGETLQRFLPDGGNLIIQTARPNSPNLNLRIMGLRSALSGKIYQTAPGEILNNDSGWTELRPPITNYDKIDRSVKQLESILKAQPDSKVNAFVAVGGWPQDNEELYREMITPFKKELLDKNIILVISDASKSQINMLRDKLAHANIGQSPYQMGYQAILTLFKIAQKQQYKKIIYTPLRYCTVSNYAACSQ